MQVFRHGLPSVSHSFNSLCCPLAIVDPHEGNCCILIRPGPAQGGKVGDSWVLRSTFFNIGLREVPFELLSRHSSPLFSVFSVRHRHRRGGQGEAVNPPRSTPRPQHRRSPPPLPSTFPASSPWRLRQTVAAVVPFTSRNLRGGELSFANLA